MDSAGMALKYGQSGWVSDWVIVYAYHAGEIHFRWLVWWSDAVTPVIDSVEVSQFDGGGWFAASPGGARRVGAFATMSDAKSAAEQWGSEYVEENHRM